MVFLGNRTKVYPGHARSSFFLLCSYVILIILAVRFIKKKNELPSTCQHVVLVLPMLTSLSIPTFQHAAARRISVSRRYSDLFFLKKQIY